MNEDRFFRAFDFIFAQPDWLTKFGIGVGLYVLSLFIPVVPLIPLAGYTALIMRAVIETETPALPEWNDWSTLFMDGLRVLGVVVTAYLPLFVLGALTFGVMFGPMLISVFVTAANNGPEEWVALGAVSGALLGVCMAGIILGLSLVLAVLAPPALAHAIALRQFIAAFRVGEWWPIFRANVAGFLIATGLLLGAGAAFVLAAQLFALTLVLICLLPFLAFPFTVYALWVGAVLYGQAYRDGLLRRAAAIS